jgi:hypothetical protein
MLCNLAHCRELDLTWCQKLPSSVIAKGLRTATMYTHIHAHKHTHTHTHTHTHSLVSVTLRGVATDEVILALASSDAARNGKLQLVDCAHSKLLTDVGVLALLGGAPRLERLNLRGTGVTTGCYYQTPITLRERKEHREEAENGGSGNDGDGNGDSNIAVEMGNEVRKRRKGVHATANESSNGDGNGYGNDNGNSNGDGDGVGDAPTRDVLIAEGAALGSGGGRGLFACRPVCPGERVLSETPLFTLRARSACSTTVGSAVASLDADARASFWALHNCRLGVEEILAPDAYGTFVTNALPCGANAIGIFPTAARLNHACGNNVIHHW